jgi:uncharacterized membrane protein
MSPLEVFEGLLPALPQSGMLRCATPRYSPPTAFGFPSFKRTLTPVEPSYLFLKFIHVGAAIFFLGNLAVTGWWKIIALRRGDPAIASFVQRYAVQADTWFSGLAALVLFLSGFTNAVRHYDYHSSFWLFHGGLTFLGMMLLWAALLIPVERKLRRIAAGFAEENKISEAYIRLWWVGIGLRSLIIFISLGLLYLMIYKPMNSPLS